jgi:lysophospholipase L1-like esterase
VHDIRQSLGKVVGKVRAFSRFHRLRLAVLLATCVVAVLAVVIWLRQSDIERAVASTPPPAGVSYQAATMEGAQRPSVLFVGDDFTAGYGGSSRNAYPYIVCSSLGLNCNVDAQTGTGFLTGDTARGAPVSGDKGKWAPTARLAERLPVDRKIYDVDLIVVDAGRNDIDAPLDQYAEALKQYLSNVAEFWPAAKMVVVVPTYMSADPSTDYATRVAMTNKIVSTYGGTVIDPLAESWYEGADLSRMTLPDGVHPNQRGQEFIAQRLAQSLRDRGIGQSGVAN